MTRVKRYLFVTTLTTLTIAGAMMKAHPAFAASSSAVQVVPNIPFGNTASYSIKVPTAHHLVIESLILQVDVTPPGSKLAASVNFTSGGKSVTIFVPLSFAYTEPKTNFDFYVATQKVRLYADPGTSITLIPYSPTGTTGTPLLTVSGYEY